MKVYGINTCGTYKKAIAWFRKHDIDFEAINLREVSPKKEELEMYHKKSKLDIKKFFNTSGKRYKELDIKNQYKTMTHDQIYQLLSEEPMLIKRPLVVDKDVVVVGFNEQDYIDRWL